MDFCLYIPPFKQLLPQSVVPDLETELLYSDVFWAESCRSNDLQASWRFFLCKWQHSLDGLNKSLGILTFEFNVLLYIC